CFITKLVKNCMEMKDSLELNKSTFSVKGDTAHSYRFTGFYFIYEFSDGDRKLIECEKEDANGIGGVGVCGAYHKFEDVIIEGRISKYLDGFTEEEKVQETEFQKRMIDEAKSS